MSDQIAHSSKSMMETLIPSLIYTIMSSIDYDPCQDPGYLPSSAQTHPSRLSLWDAITRSVNILYLPTVQGSQLKEPLPGFLLKVAHTWQ